MHKLAMFSGKERKPARGFTLIEIMIAVGLLAVTSLIFMQMFAHQNRANRSNKTVGIRDLGYYQVARFALDPAALAYTYKLSNAGSTGSKIDPCFRTCFDQGAPDSGCGEYGDEPCVSWTDSAGTRTRRWHKFTLFNPVATGTELSQISGPDPATSFMYSDPDNRPLMRYTVNGELCSYNRANKDCPIAAVTEFSPVCPRGDDRCKTAYAAQIRYSFQWITTDATVDKNQIAAQKRSGGTGVNAIAGLVGEGEVPCIQFAGASKCPAFHNNPTATFTGGQSSTVTYTNTGTGTMSVANTGTNIDTCCIIDCFKAGTMVETEIGPMPIELIQPGMKVWSMDPFGRAVLAKVLKLKPTFSRGYLEVKFRNGQKIQITQMHRVWDPLRREYRPIGAFEPGDIMMRINLDEFQRYHFEDSEIVSIERKDEPGPTYNFEVEHNHNYFSGGVLVHNLSDFCTC